MSSLLLLHLEMLYPTEAIQAHGRKYKGIVYCMFLLTRCPKRLAVNKSPLMGDRSFFPKPLLCNYIWKMSSFVLGPEIKNVFYSRPADSYHFGVSVLVLSRL